MWRYKTGQERSVGIAGQGSVVFARLAGLLCLLVLALGVFPCQALEQGQPPVQTQGDRTLEDRIRSLVAGFDGQVGLAVRMGGKEVVSLDADGRYPMCSVGKFPQALAVLAVLEEQKLPLTLPIQPAKDDLRPDTWSPMLKHAVPGQTCTVQELLTWSLVLSDNNASDLLARRLVSLADTEAFVRSLGITDFGMSAMEYELAWNGEANWTTPGAMARLLELFCTQELVSRRSQALVRELMIACRTGEGRLPLPLQGSASILGHKTGSGSIRNGRLEACNDVGFVRLADGRQYVICVFIRDAADDMEAAERLIAAISGAVHDHILKSRATRKPLERRAAGQ